MNKFDFIFMVAIMAIYMVSNYASFYTINRKLDQYEQKLEEIHLILNNADTCQE